MIMASSSKQMVDKKMKQVEIESVQDNNSRSNNTSGVVITVYEESARPRSRKQLQDSIRRPITQSYYDRRAQLLAHSKQLRNHHAASSQNVALPTIHSETKSKKGFSLTKPVRICHCSPSRYMPLRFISFGCSRYEPVDSQENKERKRSNTRNSIGETCPPFLSNVKKMLKELSCKEI